MATGTVTYADRSGPNVVVTVTVDEGLAGMVPYTAEVPIAELKALATNAARRQAILAAIIAVRDAALEEETKVDAFLGTLIGGTVTV